MIITKLLISFSKSWWSARAVLDTDIACHLYLYQVTHDFFYWRKYHDMYRQSACVPIVLYCLYYNVTVEKKWKLVQQLLIALSLTELWYIIIKEQLNWDETVAIDVVEVNFGVELTANSIMSKLLL